MIINADYSELERGILRTIAYFDVFSYPLTKVQLLSFLAHETTELLLEEAIKLLVQKKLIHSSQEYFYSSTRGSDIVIARLENERRAAKMLKHARLVTFFLKQVPFVRAVFITGSLSKNVAPRKSDIDFMIVAEINRLWVCKMILTAFRRIFLFNSKKYFCINLMVTEKAIYFADHNYFTAVEIATAQVIWNTAAFMKFQNENAWIHHYFPNWRYSANGPAQLSNSPSTLQRIFESALNILPLDAINTNLMQTARNFWRRKHLCFDENKFNSIIQCKPDISSVWPDDQQTQIHHIFHQRLAEYGIREAA